MSKRPKKRAPQPHTETLAERDRRDAKQRLQRANRQEREIQLLSRKLSRALVRSDDELTALARQILERVTEAEPDDKPQAAETV